MRCECKQYCCVWKTHKHDALLRIGRGGATPPELFQGTLLEETSAQEPRKRDDHHVVMVICNFWTGQGMKVCPPPLKKPTKIAASQLGSLVAVNALATNRQFLENKHSPSEAKVNQTTGRGGGGGHRRTVAGAVTRGQDGFREIAAHGCKEARLR